MRFIPFITSYLNKRLQLHRIDALNQINREGQLLLLWIGKRGLMALASVLLFAAHYPAYATDFYVDADGGDDELKLFL